MKIRTRKVKKVIQTKFIRRILSISFIYLFIYGCTSYKNQVVGNWHINDVYYHNEPVVYDLPGNYFNLLDNNVCRLPTQYNEQNTAKEHGQWTYYKKDGISYLNVVTENELFNRTYTIINLEKKQDMESYGYYYEMTLVADSLKMICWRQHYGK